MAIEFKTLFYLFVVFNIKVNNNNNNSVRRLSFFLLDLQNNSKRMHKGNVKNILRHIFMFLYFIYFPLNTSE